MDRCKWRNDYYQRHKERLNAEHRAKKTQVKSLAIEYLSGKCERCGLIDECVNVYDFHHKNPDEEEFEFATWSKKANFSEEMKKELDKCELLCAICHRKAHGCCKRQI